MTGASHSRTGIAASVFLSLFLIYSSPALGEHSRWLPTPREECSSEYLQGCKSCKQLSQILSRNEPDNGDYYHGAQWNGLYAAYVHNCFEVANSLLKRGANPNWGGWQGSMILSIVDKWPHDNRKTNQKWAALLLKYGADPKKLVPDQEKTPEMMVKDGDFEPDYPDLWKNFLN